MVLFLELARAKVLLTPNLVVNGGPMLARPFHLELEVTFLMTLLEVVLYLLDRHEWLTPVLEIFLRERR